MKAFTCPIITHLMASSQVIKEPISKARRKKKNDSGAYFDAVNWDRKDMMLKEISVVKVCPINQHSR